MINRYFFIVVLYLFFITRHIFSIYHIQWKLNSWKFNSFTLLPNYQKSLRHFFLIIFILPR